MFSHVFGCSTCTPCWHCHGNPHIPCQCVQNKAAIENKHCFILYTAVRLTVYHATLLNRSPVYVQLLLYFEQVCQCFTVTMVSHRMFINGMVSYFYHMVVDHNTKMHIYYVWSVFFMYPLQYPCVPLGETRLYWNKHPGVQDLYLKKKEVFSFFVLINLFSFRFNVMYLWSCIYVTLCFNKLMLMINVWCDLIVN